VRILLLDDHQALRLGLRRIVEERPGWEVVAEASDSAEGLRKAEQHTPDIAIIDVSMPLPEAVDTIRQLRQRVPCMRIVVLSMHADDTYVTELLEAGAMGYLLKDHADLELQQAVTDVAQGDVFISGAITF
jgi:DNA-binding NarL/FixJ family response regulator